MANLLIWIIFAVCCVFVIAMLMVLFAVQRMGRRIAQLARQTQELAQQAEKERLAEPPSEQEKG